MRNNLKALTLICAIALSGNVLAESASDSLTRIEAETLILKAREKQLEIQARILARQNEITARQTDTNRQTQAAPAGNPVIHSIEAIGGTTYATLQLDNGSMIDVKTGDVLPNGMKVVSIGPNDVVVQNAKKRRVRLATAAQSAAAFNPNFPGPGVGLPAMTPAGTQTASVPQAATQPAVPRAGGAR